MDTVDTQGWLYSKDLMENNLAQYSQDGKRISLQDFASLLHVDTPARTTTFAHWASRSGGTQADAAARTL